MTVRDEYDLRDLGVFKNYRVVKKWASDTNKITSTDFEYIMVLFQLRKFTIQEFSNISYLHKWENKRMQRYVDEGWVEIFSSTGGGKSGKKRLYKVTRKTDHMMLNCYRILLGKQEIPISYRNPYYEAEGYTAKVANQAIDLVNKEIRNKNKRNNNGKSKDIR